jgi:hypothetical protein
MLQGPVANHSTTSSSKPTEQYSPLTIGISVLLWQGYQPDLEALKDTQPTIIMMSQARQSADNGAAGEPKKGAKQVSIRLIHLSSPIRPAKTCVMNVTFSPQVTYRPKTVTHSVPRQGPPAALAQTLSSHLRPLYPNMGQTRTILQGLS